MKTAIYVEDGVTQIVLTPVTTFEREVLARISREEVVHVRVAKGSFHRDPEGWQRFAGAGMEGEPQEQCLMLRLGAEVKDPAVAGAAEAFDADLTHDILPLQVDGSSRHTFRPRDL